VLKALGRAKWNGRKVVVEVASDEPADDKEGKKKHDRHGEEKGSRKESRREKHEESESHAKKHEGKKKASREERGYTKPRGKKDDWKKFFEQPEPDFSEEGWARRSPKKK
jgi:ATP-dependent RNA helicase DeaD